jgi:hypothetical protein
MDSWDDLPLGLQLMARHAWDSGFVRLAGIGVWLRQFGYDVTTSEISLGINRA